MILFELLILVGLFAQDGSETPQITDDETVTILDLSNKGITSLNEYDFPKYNLLEELDLSNNDIEHLKEKTFLRNSNLKKLNLSGNKNLKLPQYSTLLDASIEEINLSNCNIEALPTNIFDGLLQLKNIDLSNNPLEDDAIKLPTLMTLMSPEKVILPEVDEPMIRELCKQLDIVFEIKSEDYSDSIKCDDVRAGIWRNTTKEQPEENHEADNTDLNVNLAEDNTDKVEDDNHNEELETEKEEGNQDETLADETNIQHQTNGEENPEPLPENINNEDGNVEPELSPEGVNNTAPEPAPEDPKIEDANVEPEQSPDGTENTALEPVPQQTNNEDGNTEPELLPESTNSTLPQSEPEKTDNEGNKVLESSPEETNSTNDDTPDTIDGAIPDATDAAIPDTIDGAIPDAIDGKGEPNLQIRGRMANPPLNQDEALGKENTENKEQPPAVLQKEVVNGPLQNTETVATQQNKSEKMLEKKSSTDQSDAGESGIGSNVLVFLVIAVIVAGVAAFGYKFYKSRTYQAAQPAEPVERELKEIVVERRSNGPNKPTNVIEEEPLMERRKNSVEIKEIDETNDKTNGNTRIELNSSEATKPKMEKTASNPYTPTTTLPSIDDDDNDDDDDGNKTQI